MAASIVVGTIRLALSPAFEAAHVPQTIISLSRERFQTGFDKVAQIGNGSGDTNGEDDWLGHGNGQSDDRRSNSATSVQTADSVPTRKDVRGTSIMPSRANNTAMSPGTTRYGNGNSTRTVARS